MKSDLSRIALVGAAFLCAGSAQAQLTIYGRANVDFEKTSLNGTPAADAFGGNQRVSSNSSRFGIRASTQWKDIRAFGQVETGVSWDVGGDTIAGRDTFVGLESGWGMVRLGKMDGPTKEQNGLTDRFKGAGIQDDASLAHLGGGGNGFNRRLINSIRYDSPVFAGGLKGTIQYGFENEDRSSGQQHKVLDTGLTYSSGPFKAGVTYQAHKNLNVVGRTDTEWALRANYDFGMVNVGAGFSRLKYDIAAGTLQRSFTSLSAAVPVGDGAIIGRWSRAGNVGGSAPVGTTITGGDGAQLFRGPDSGARQITFGYEHNLFKGAQLYAYWTKVANQRNANYRFGGNPLNLAAADRGADPSGFVVGIVYDF